jgi:hypothetical protein
MDGSRALHFPIRLRCADLPELLRTVGLEDALARALVRAFARARAALPAALAVAGGVVLQPPNLVGDDLAAGAASELLARIRRAIAVAARNAALPLAAAPVSGRVAQGSSSENVSEPFDPARFDEDTASYLVPAYKDGSGDIGSHSEQAVTVLKWSEPARSVSSFGAVSEGTDNKALQLELSRIASSTDTTLKDQALKDVRQGAKLWDRLTQSRWESDRLRRLYTKHYLVATEIAAGRGEPNSDVLYFALLDTEQKYQEYVHQEHERQELEHGLATVRAQSAKYTLNPLTDFEPGQILVPLATAKTDARWVESDIVDGRANISEQWKTQALTLIYQDGATLDIPLAPDPLMFLKPLPEADAITPFFRRHKKSGRLVPFQVTTAQFAQIAPTNLPIEVALAAVPPRFDPYLTPLILTWRDLVNDRQLAAQLQVLTIGFGALATATSFTSINPAGLARVTETTAAAGTRVAVQAGTLARAGLTEIRFAVTNYGLRRAAISYLGRAAYTFYLRNAVAVNLAALATTDFALSLAGIDTGPVNPGDALYFAVQDEKVAWQVLKAEVIEVDEANQIAKVKLTPVERITAEKADEAFDAGRVVYHEKVPSRPKPPVIPKQAQAAHEERLAAAAKAKAVPPAKVAPRPLGGIHHAEILSDADVTKLTELGVKPEALEKLRTIEIGELERMGLKPREITNLYRRIAASESKGGAVVDFINQFHEAPGFEFVVLNWAKGGAARPGTNFVMKYALANFRNKAIRFEWPVAVAVTRTGEEGSMAARYVDVVVDGGSSFRPGEALRVELKAWTDRFLSVPQAGKTITRQLVRDTAFFGKDNIRWVFDSTKTTKDNVIKAFMQAIKNDDFLRKQWTGTDDEIRAALEQLIEMYPP